VGLPSIGLRLRTAVGQFPEIPSFGHNPRFSTKNLLWVSRDLESAIGQGEFEPVPINGSRLGFVKGYSLKT
jgi:hypothetical protein